MNRTILVTGASGGIGRACAIHLSELGFELVLHYRSRRDRADALLQEIGATGGKGRILGFDVADRAECEGVLTKDIQENGVYWGVVCNAGIASDAPFPAMSGDQWDGVIHTNLDSFYNVLHPLVMPMVQARQKGRIVTISSLSGIVGNRGQVNYAAAKAGIIGATKSLAQELAKREMTVNCVAPGLIETEMIQGAPVEEIVKVIPMRRLGKPEEVAGVVGFLFSERAGYITGQVISVNGGLA